MPGVGQLTDADIAAKVVGFVGVEFANAFGGVTSAYWTVFGSHADALRYLPPGTPVVSGDPNVQLTCDSGKNAAGTPLAVCYGLRAGSLVVVQGSMRTSPGDADPSVALAYAKSGLQYLASLER